MKNVIRISVICLSFLWVLHTFSKNFMIDPQLKSFISRKEDILSNQFLWLLMIRIHITLAIISLIAGPLGIIKAVRIKSSHFHRWNGRIYILSIIFNFIPGIYVSFFATGGWLSTIGFLILNTLWLVTTILGYWYIKSLNIIKHRQWMIRSLFLSFANLTIYIIVLITNRLIGFSYEYSYTIAVWLCLIINLYIADFIINKKIFL